MNTYEFMKRMKDCKEGREETYTQDKVKNHCRLNSKYGDETINHFICVEELMELGKEISKCKRSTELHKSISDIYVADLLQEIADVLNCIEYLKYKYNISDEDVEIARSLKVKQLHPFFEREGIDYEKEN